MTQNNRPYVLWRRVSTKEQGDSKLGLEAQSAIAEFFMRCEPIETFTDVYSGTKLAECPNLSKAMKYCKEYGYMLVIAKTDRFRNVKEALAILDEMGEGNLSFCDLPTTDRTVLTMMFAMWERQAIMGRINTKLALNERRKQRDKHGYWISNTGNIRTHFGREKGCDMSAAATAAAISHTERKEAWRESSPAFKWVMDKVRSGMPRKEIIAEFNRLHELQPDVFCTPRGAKLSAGVLSYWIKDSAEIV